MMKFNPTVSTIRTAAVLGASVWLAACAAPDNRSYENGWDVYTNACGEMSSKVRRKLIAETRLDVELTLFDIEDKTIYVLKSAATRTGTTATGTTYANTPANTVVETRELKRQDINEDIAMSVDTYFGQPGKHQEIDFQCLVKGYQAL